MSAGTVLFAWRRTPPPFLIGGAEVSQRLLAEEFASSGWRVVYLGSHERPWVPMIGSSSCLHEMRIYLARRRIWSEYSEPRDELRYSYGSIDCRAVRQDGMASAFTEALAALRPDLVITSQEGSADFAAEARPQSSVAGWLHSVSKTGFGVLEGEPHWALATSRFVLSRVPTRQRTRSVLFYPPFRRPPAVPVPSRTRDLLMINPIPAKGADLIHRLAERMSNRQFTLVEGWWDTGSAFAGRSNITYVPRTYDMAAVYAQHRLLLVPSIVEDAFPRVIIEAGLAGLPSVGSSRGGIPEAIAGGGLLLPPDDLSAWAAAIRSLDSPSSWAAMSYCARERATNLTRTCLPELTAAGIIT